MTKNKERIVQRKKKKKERILKRKRQKKERKKRNGGIRL